MRRFAAGLVLVGLLAACGQADQFNGSATTEESAGGYAQRVQGGEAPPAAPPPPPAPADARDADVAQQPAPQAGQPSQPAGPSPVLYLAYTYGVGLEIPSQRLSSVWLEPHGRS
jgi:hypothetical protein